MDKKLKVGDRVVSASGFGIITDIKERVNQYDDSLDVIHTIQYDHNSNTQEMGNGFKLSPCPKDHKWSPYTKMCLNCAKHENASV